MASDILTVTVTDAPGTATVLTVTGEIDRDSRSELRDAAAGRPRLILDLGAVTFCDSSGLSLFVDLHRQTQTDGGWLRLAHVSPDVRTMLAITHLDRLFDLYDTVEDATPAP